MGSEWNLEINIIASDTKLMQITSENYMQIICFFYFVTILFYIMSSYC